jgi:hypothetical protein
MSTTSVLFREMSRGHVDHPGWYSRNKLGASAGAWGYALGVAIDLGVGATRLDVKHEVIALTRPRRRPNRTPPRTCLGTGGPTLSTPRCHAF